MEKKKEGRELQYLNFIIQVELKERKLTRRKDIRKMINRNGLIYKLEGIIEYLKKC